MAKQKTLLVEAEVLPPRKTAEKVVVSAGGYQHAAELSGNAIAIPAAGLPGDCVIEPGVEGAIDERRFSVSSCEKSGDNLVLQVAFL